MQIGGIQMQMARRGQEMKTLREQIAKLEADLGLRNQRPARPASSSVRQRRPPGASSPIQW